MAGAIDGAMTGARRRLVETLREKGIRDLAVLRAFDLTPRHAFVPSGVRHRAYEDAPLPIGSGQTISQPSIHARYLELLQLKGTERVLEIGTGSGYQTAVLALLSRRVYSVETIKPLQEGAAHLLESLRIHNVTMRVGDGSLGWPEQAPFDRIIVTAASGGEVPRALVDQLGEGGILICPVRRAADDQMMVRLRRENGQIASEDLWAVRFVPLVSRRRTGKQEKEQGT